ncbi:DUF3455 domain-containing protein [soil metagenome]
MNHFYRTLPAPLVGTLLAACAATPVALDPGAGLRPSATVQARGVQVYECRIGGTPAAGAWAFVAPEADLFDATGRRIGSHGAGPTWTAADGSRIVGQVVARHEVQGAIPWLLLRTRSAGGPGTWAEVVAIQRIHTEGGLAPTSTAQACDTPRIGQRVRVPYRADYRLFAAT